MLMARRKIVIQRLLLLPFGLMLNAWISAEELPRGVPIDQVICEADTSQSYALYLPSSYSCDRRWPIIYCFEAGARGPVPIGRFRAAAEKYGYILVCSNNSRNGPVEPIFRALQAVWTDTQKRFCTDNSRVYSAGHSGGAQVALEFGRMLGRPWAGAIVCCGGRMPGYELPRDIAVYLTTGLYDFNYWPTRQLDADLEAIRVEHHLEIFKDGHTWLPPDVAMAALDWLELQAMKQGKKVRDDAWIASQFERRLQLAREVEQRNKPAEAYEAYQTLISDFRGLADTKEEENALAGLCPPAEIEKQRSVDQKAADEEMRLLSATVGAMEAFMNAADVRERRFFMEQMEIPRLQREAKQGDETESGLSARRVLGFLFGRTWLAASQAYERSDMKAARDFYELAVLIQPDYGYAHLNLACVYSRLKETKKALRSLEAAIENGVKNREAIAKDPDFETIRHEPAFIKLLEKIKGNA